MLLKSLLDFPLEGQAYSRAGGVGKWFVRVAKRHPQFGYGSRLLLLVAFMQQLEVRVTKVMSRMSGVKAMSAVLAVACAAVSAPAFARDVVTFRSMYGWSVGDTSDSRYADGLMVSLQIRSSHSDSKIYAVAEFCNRGSSDWTGGIRVSPDYPDSAHTTLRVPAGQCRRWGEHMDRTNTVFVFANRGE